MTKGLIARKMGMTQLFNADGTLSAVTVLEAGPCRVVGLRTWDEHRLSKEGWSLSVAAMPGVHSTNTVVRALLLSRPLSRNQEQKRVTRFF